MAEPVYRQTVEDRNARAEARQKARAAYQAEQDAAAAAKKRDVAIRDAVGVGLRLVRLVRTVYLTRKAAALFGYQLTGRQAYTVAAAAVMLVRPQPTQAEWRAGTDAVHKMAKQLVTRVRDVRR
jgi:hypothetical protein